MSQISEAIRVGYTHLLFCGTDVGFSIGNTTMIIKEVDIMECTVLVTIWKEQEEKLCH